MREYPRNLEEFEASFPSEEACRDYLCRIRWPNGFRCARCGSQKAYPIGTVLYQCAKCRYQTSVIAGTIFQDTHKPLRMWFRAIWWVTGQKNGASALGLKRILGLGSYQTAWSWLHKMRTAMVRPGRDRLTGVVEVDESYVGGETSAKRGRGAEGKALVVVAVEDKADKGVGRIRMAVVPDASAESLTPFVQACVQEGSTVRTDGWRGYDKLKSAGYNRIVERKDACVGHKPLKLAHLAISLLKRWLMGTHQGATSHEHLPYYLDEFVFRFNRRTSTHRGLLFLTLLQNSVLGQPLPYKKIVKHVRGPKPKDHYMLGVA
ncbi:IS1595 family transposase [Acidobacteria bacterium AH-259-O06]|nr:IS1595 family transposase [Acidobacteria bacterium AH-259-O06]